MRIFILEDDISSRLEAQHTYKDRHSIHCGIAAH
jgi:hypothetical protein